METTVLRIADTLLALFWLWVLVRSLAAGRIGGARGFMASRAQRPGQFWGWIALLALMVLHFGGLAYTGQNPA